MKAITLLLFLSAQLFSQTKHSTTDFFLQDKKIYWRHVFDAPESSKEKLISYFTKETMITNSITNQQVADSTVIFTVKNDKVDFKKYGGTSLNTAFIAQLYLNYLVVIDFKDNRYRVTVKEIFLDSNTNYSVRMSGNIEDFAAKKDGQEFKKSISILNGLEYDHQHFIEKFRYKQTDEAKW